jgi:subtilisin family serine protease
MADYDGLTGGLAAPTCFTDQDDTFADFSNFGPLVEVAAPGVCIYSTWLNNGYTTLSGTSMATPFVTGAVARYIAQTGFNPTNRAQVLQLRDALVANAYPQSGLCGFSGDPDSTPEPLLFLNSTWFGGTGVCGDSPGTTTTTAPTTTTTAPTTTTTAPTTTTTIAPASLNVQSVIVTRVNRRNYRAKVTIADQLGAAVSGASVSGRWTWTTSSGSQGRNRSGTTNTSGVATITSGQLPNSFTNLTFCVTSVSKSGYPTWTGSICALP